MAAHPDDIEFVMAGTLLRLKERGWDIHYFNLSTGNCGSVRYSAAKTRQLRLPKSSAPIFIRPSLMTWRSFATSSSYAAWRP
jgi:LmbE family N-acetylglucosaminyl deacetylase